MQPSDFSMLLKKTFKMAFMGISLVLPDLLFKILTTPFFESTSSHFKERISPLRIPVLIATKKSEADTKAHQSKHRANPGAHRQTEIGV
jgi:hypothetical protein